MSTQVATTNYVEKVRKMSAKSSMNEAVKAMTSIKDNYSKLAVVVNHIITNEYMTRDDLAIELGLSKATLTKMQKAGDFYMNHPDMLNVEYSKAYLLGKAEKNGMEVTDNMLEMSQSQLQEISKKALDTEHGYIDTDNVSESDTTIETGEVLNPSEDLIYSVAEEVTRAVEDNLYTGYLTEQAKTVINYYSSRIASIVTRYLYEISEDLESYLLRQERLYIILRESEDCE